VGAAALVPNAQMFSIHIIFARPADVRGVLRLARIPVGAAQRCSRIRERRRLPRARARAAPESPVSDSECPPRFGASCPRAYHFPERGSAPRAAARCSGGVRPVRWPICSAAPRASPGYSARDGPPRPPLILATPTPPPARLWWRAGGNRIHVAIQALALENARLRAELACYRALEACGAERVHRTLVGAGGAALHGKR
jgi:hypothetical protein